MTEFFPSEFFSVCENLNSWEIRAKPRWGDRVHSCKRRWIDQKITDVVKCEFSWEIDESDVELIDYTQLEDKLLENPEKEKLFLIRKGKRNKEFFLLESDKIFFRKFFQEPVVHLDSLPNIFARHKHFLAVFKPHGLPTVPQGVFFLTNLDSLLKKKFPGQQFHPLHRLDRCTAGVVVFSSEKVNDFPIFDKKYFARINNIEKFPESDFACDFKLRVEKHVEGQELKTVVDEKQGIEAQTIFKKIHHHQQALVECSPVTGRTHQIRVHLSSLGFPILGDSTYGDINIKTTEVEMGNKRRRRCQPDRICLLAYSCKIQVSESEIVQFSVPSEIWPSWLSN